MQAKFYVFGFLLCCLSGLAPAQNGVLQLEKREHSFGEVQEGPQAVYVFNFRNMGSGPLTVTQVNPSCGCTTPDWTRTPILPGGQGVIKVSYQTLGRPGAFRKGIVVKTDGDPIETTLMISGTVIPKSLSGSPLQGNLAIFKESVQLGGISGQVPHQAVFYVQNFTDEPMRVLGIETDLKHVTVKMQDKTTLFPMIVTQVPVELRLQDLKAGDSFSFPVVLVTDDPAQPKKSLLVSGVITP